MIEYCLVTGDLENVSTELFVRGKVKSLYKKPLEPVALLSEVIIKNENGEVSS